MVEQAARAHSPWSYALMFQLGGAIAEVDPELTAYSRRDVPYELNVNAVWLPGQPFAAREMAWAREFIGALGPYHAGAYVNFLDRDDDGRAAEAFDARTRARLAELRRRFDPDGTVSRNLPGTATA